MDIFGIGPVELLLILFVALIFLGPNKMVEAGRYMGKAMKELRRVTSDIPKMIVEEEEEKSKKAPKEPEGSVSYQKEPAQEKEEGEASKRQRGKG